MTHTIKMPSFLKYPNLSNFLHSKLVLWLHEGLPVLNLTIQMNLVANLTISHSPAIKCDASLSFNCQRQH